MRRSSSTTGWADGQITSVRAALDAAGDLGADRVVIGLADQPFVTPDAWRTVADGPGPIAVATYAGRRGNPVGARPFGLGPAARDRRRGRPGADAHSTRSGP